MERQGIDNVTFIDHMADIKEYMVMDYTVISTISFTIFCNAAVCDFNYILWDSQAMLWDLYGML